MMSLRVKILCVLLCVYQSFGTIIADTSYESLLAELQLDDLELVDVCDDIARGKRTAILTHNFKEKVTADRNLGEFLKSHSESLKQFEDVPDELRRNWTSLVYPGDGLLQKDEWDKLISFGNNINEMTTVTKVPCTNGSADCFFTKTEYKNVLRNSRDLNVLKTTWEFWHNIYNESSKEQFGTILELVKEAATANEKNDVKSYWEFLTDVEDGYEKANRFWEEIKPFYLNFHQFVKKRLLKYYNVDENSDNIPVYLLGDSLARDWSSVADIVLPHPQVHYDIETSLNYKTLRDVYKMASNVTQYLKIGNLNELFWKNSHFNMEACGAEILYFCAGEYSEIFECDSPTWESYLDAYETSFKITLAGQDYTSLPRLQLRHSALDEAVATLGTLMAIETLPKHGILDQYAFDSDTEDTSKNMTKLLLTALRVLPGLPYYLAGDTWRLNFLAEREDVIKSWWRIRQEYQGVSGETNEEWDFWGDQRILFNKPYLSKFFGTIFAFQIMEYYKNQGENSVIDAMAQDDNFVSMLNERASTDWEYLLTSTYGTDLSATPLLEYFKPLEDYFENAPLEQKPIVTTTTTTTTTTSKPTSTTTSTVKPTKLERFDGKSEVVLSDDPKANATTLKDGGNSTQTVNIATYVGVGLLALVACLLVAGFVYKKSRRRKRTNNRRFDG